MTEPTNDKNPEGTKSKQEPPKQVELTIEELAVRNNVDNWVITGMMKAYGWGTGKRLTEKDFLSKKDEWLNGPMYRSKK